MSHIRKYWTESRKVIVSLIVLGAILPVVIWAVVNKQQLALLASAQPVDELRIWAEPPEVVMAVGNKAKFSLMAEYSSPDKMIPLITSKITVSDGVEVSPNEVIFKKGFSGKQKIGEIEVTAVKAGENQLTISDKDVYTSLPDLDIVTAGAKIWVK